MNRLKQLWRNLTTSTEFALVKAENRRLLNTNLALEEELAQAQKELRAAVNNLLTHAGAAPLPGAEEVKPPSGRIRNLSWQQQQRIHAVKTQAEQVEQTKTPKERPPVCGNCGGAHLEKDCLLKRKEA